MTGPYVSKRGADIDPDLRRFMAMTAAAYAGHPDVSALPLPEARKVFEKVREPWRAGGPVMAATRDLTVETRHGGVRARIHDPSPDRPKPALIYLHGGGWTIFSIETHDRVMREYAARAGVVVLGVDYALSPEAKFPVALEQVLDVVGWLRREAAEFGVDPARVAIGGDSAGGNLALATCLALRDQGRGAEIAALVLNYAVLDTDSTPEFHTRFGGADYMLTSEEMAQFWANYLGAPVDAENPLANPALAKFENLPPTFLAVAECDVLAGQSLAAAARLKEAGVPVECRVYAGACHSFLEAVSIAPIAGRAFDEASIWLRERLAIR
jgi:acetyl esterase